MRPVLRRHRLGPLVVVGAASAGAPLVGCVGDEPTVASIDASRDDAKTSDGGDAPTTDAAQGDTGAQPDAARTFCENTVPGPGVTDYFCADFDGVDFGSWSKVVKDDGGVLEKTTDVATSLPYALVAASASSTPGGGSLVWSSIGARNFKFATAEVQVNPEHLGGAVSPTTGSVELIEIRTPTTFVSLNASRDGSDGGTNGVRYFVIEETTGGAAVAYRKPVATALSAGVWTKVGLAYGNDGSVELYYNDISVFSDDAFAVASPSVKFTVGATGSIENAVLERFRFDNAQLSVTR